MHVLSVLACVCDYVIHNLIRSTSIEWENCTTMFKVHIVPLLTAEQLTSESTTYYYSINGHKRIISHR